MSKPAQTRAAASSRRRPKADATDTPEDIRDAVNRLKRERIVAAAVELFYRQGYGHTTLEQVADTLNVTKPFIYAHFRSKSELLAEICSRAIRLALLQHPGVHGEGAVLRHQRGKEAGERQTSDEDSVQHGGS